MNQFIFKGSTTRLHPPWKSKIVICVLNIFVWTLLPVPVFGMDESYEKLQDRLRNNASVDTVLIRSLPEPNTAHEYHLRSKTRKKVDTALSDLDAAVESSSPPPEDLLIDWLNLSLLTKPSTDRLQRLQSLMKSTSPDERSGKVWRLAGKYAAFHDRYPLAARWTRHATLDESTKQKALLDLAKYRLEMDDYKTARTVLDRYLLLHSETTPARVWRLKGRLLQNTGSDSRAYLAYNHVIRNYPNSLELEKAKNAVDSLSLPAGLEPAKPDGRPSREDTSETKAVRGSREENWKIQLGSFLSLERAKAFKERLGRRLDRSLAINEAIVDGRQYHRVQVVGFESKGTATEVKRDLRQRGYENAFVLRN